MVTWHLPRLCLYYRRAISCDSCSWLLANCFHLQAKIWLNASASISTVWTSIFAFLSHRLSTAITALAFGVGVTNMYETVCRVVTEDAWVYCTEKSYFPFHLPFFEERLAVERKVVAASWQCHGNRTSSFLKASVYPEHTSTQTQHFHIHPPQRSFLKSSVFSVGL